MLADSGCFKDERGSGVVTRGSSFGAIRASLSRLRRGVQGREEGVTGEVVVIITTIITLFLVM